MQVWTGAPPLHQLDLRQEIRSVIDRDQSLGFRRLEQTQRAADVRRFHVPETCGDVDDSVVSGAERVDLDALRVRDPWDWQRIDRHDHHVLVENVVVFDVCTHCQWRGLVAAAEKNRGPRDTQYPTAP